MVSGDTFHFLARAYAVLNLLGSIYAVCNRAMAIFFPKVLVLDDKQLQQQFENILDYVRPPTSLLVTFLLVAIISLGASVVLMVGAFNKKLQLVKIYKVYTLVSVGATTILGCIILGVLAQDKWWIAIIIFAIACAIVILPITALIIWILNGEIRFLEQEQEHGKHTVNHAQMHRSLAVA